MAAFLPKPVAASDWTNDQSRIDLRLIHEKDKGKGVIRRTAANLSVLRFETH
jgi:hypothetical protein